MIPSREDSRAGEIAIQNLRRFYCRRLPWNDDDDERSDLRWFAHSIGRVVLLGTRLYSGLRSLLCFLSCFVKKAKVNGIIRSSNQVK